MASQEFHLMAHLMRRAGFGASREELDALVEQGYEATVESPWPRIHAATRGGDQHEDRRRRLRRGTRMSLLIGVFRK